MAFLSQLGTDPNDPNISQYQTDPYAIPQAPQQGGLLSLPNTGGGQSQQNGAFHYNTGNDIPAMTSRAQVEGYLDRQKLDMARDENSRENSSQNIKEQTFGWAKKDWQRADAVRTGMTQAAEQGGYGAVVDYLRTADPNAALDFEAKKSDLDSKIMSNQTYAIAHQNDKSTAMLQAYQMLGGVGSTLMKMKPEERSDGYQQLLPIMKQINPDMSDKLDSNSISQLMLGMSLSTPASILYNTQKAQVQYQSEIGKTLGDLQTVSDKYGSNSEQAKAMQANLVNQQMQAQKNQLVAASTIARNQARGESGLRNQWVNTDKDYQETANHYSAMQEAATTGNAKDGKPKGVNDLALVGHFFSILNPGSVIAPGQRATLENTASWSEAQRETYNQVLNGTPLTEEKRQSLLETAGQYYQQKLQDHESLRSQYNSIAMDNGYNPDHITVDEQKETPRPSDASVKALLQNAHDPNVRKQFQWKFGQDQLNKVLNSAQPIAQPGATAPDGALNAQ